MLAVADAHRDEAPTVPAHEPGDVLFECRDHVDGRAGCAGELVVVKAVGDHIVEFECNDPVCKHAGSFLVAALPALRRRAWRREAQRERWGWINR